MSSLEAVKVDFLWGISRFEGPECSIARAVIHTQEGAGRMHRQIKTVILALCAALLVAASLLAAGKPKATVAEPVSHVGTVPKGEKIVHDFLIKNAGDGELPNTNVQPARGRTAADLDKAIM